MLADDHKGAQGTFCGDINVLYLNWGVNYISACNISMYGCQRHTMPHLNLCILVCVIIDQNIFNTKTQW